MPADSGIGFRCEARSFSVWVASRVNVSEMVVRGAEARRLMSDSMAAIGGVMFGSLAISLS